MSTFSRSTTKRPQSSTSGEAHQSKVFLFDETARDGQGVFSRSHGRNSGDSEIPNEAVEEVEESVPESKKASDMQFPCFDIHNLPKGVKKVTEEEEILEPTVYPPQSYLAKVIIERFVSILEENESSSYKLLPLLEQANGTRCIRDDEKVFTGFNFVIYTAISNMLEHQTAMRLAEPQSKVLSPEIYKSSWKVRGAEALKKVKKYHPEVIKSTHEELVKEVERNPQILFLIVADEAHVAITKNEDEEEKTAAAASKSGPKVDAAGDHQAGSEECGVPTITAKEKETANNTLVNFWKHDKHPNVIVLQVSATPANLLTSRSRIPKSLVVKTKINESHTNVGNDSEMFDVNLLKDVSLGRGGKLLNKVTGRPVEKHHVKWAESHDLQIKQGLIVTLKMFDVWLCSDKDAKGDLKPWIGTTDVKERDPYYHFKIQGENGIVSVYSGQDFQWKLVVIPSVNDQPERAAIGFVEVDKCDNQRAIQNFQIHMEVGENAFHLIVQTEKWSRHLKLNPTDTENDFYPVEVHPNTHEPKRVAGLVDGETYFTFCIFHKWNPEEYESLLGRHQDVFNRVYVPLNHYYNTMSFSETKSQLIREDPGFQNIARDLKETRRKDHVLASDYSYFILLIEHLRQSEFVVDSLEKVLQDPANALGKFTESRSLILDQFRRRLDELLGDEKRIERKDKRATNATDYPPISKVFFNKFVSKYEERSAAEFSKWIDTCDTSNANEVDEDDFLEFVTKLCFCLIHFNRVVWDENISPKVKKILIVFQKISKIQDKALKEFYSSKKLDILESNETFQIVNDLVIHPDADTLDGKMKIIRVSGIDNGNILYTSVCLARQVISNNNDTYTFEIIRDFGTFKLRDFQKKSDSELVERNMVYRVRRILQQEKCGHRDAHTLEPCGCEKYQPVEPDLECTNCRHEHTEVTTYKDLNKLPCLLILQRRGRLGDTFPRSFNCMDLRICYTNEIGNHSTVVQDLGRMCRYASRKNGLDYDDLPYALVGRKLIAFLRGKDPNFMKLEVMRKHSNFQGPFVMLGGNCIDYYVKPNREGGVDPKKPSFDCGNEKKHKNRVLLEAEPQIGKTGVYLNVIAKLRQLIEGDEEITVDNEPEDVDEASPEMESDLEAFWQFPYHKEMKVQLLPKSTQIGKYCRIYGPYEYGKEPVRNVFRESSQRKMSENSAKKNNLPPPKKYRSHTSDHDTCIDCSITVGHQIVPIHVAGTDTIVLIPNRVRFDIVRKKLNGSVLNTLEANTLVDMPTEGRFRDPDYSSDCLKSWIFTPTHGRSMTGNLNLTHNMVSQTSGSDKYIHFVHILVVRKGQFDDYTKKWGSSHVILQLPDVVPEWYGDHGENCSAEAGKIGFSRKFIQAFAEHYELGTIFMLDDNMPYFYEVCTQIKDGKEFIVRDGAIGVKYKQVPLYTVLKHLECLHVTQADAPMIDFEAHEEFPGQFRASYTGPPDNYGVIGIRKHDKYNMVKNPFRAAHVYSLYLINIAALRNLGIQYKPWQAWEDLHLNNECDEKGLYVVKYNRFKAIKRHLSTWQREGFEWTDKEMKRGTLKIDEEDNLLYRWIRRFARPGRCEEAWPDGFKVPKSIDNIMKKMKECIRAKDHLVALHPASLQNYIEINKGLDGFSRHVLLLPFTQCAEMGLLTVASLREKLIEPYFCPADDRNEIQVKILTSHNVEEFKVTTILVYIEGKVKNPNMEPCTEPFNLPIPVTRSPRKKTSSDSPSDAQKDTSSADDELNGDTTKPSENTLGPDSDVEDTSSPEITMVENVQTNNNSNTAPGNLPEVPMVISDDDDNSVLLTGSEANPISLSGDEQIDENPAQAETQRMSDYSDTQFSSGSDDSPPIPYELKPAESPKSILRGIPNVSRQSSISTEDPDSPSLLESNYVPNETTASGNAKKTANRGRSRPVSTENRSVEKAVPSSVGSRKSSESLSSPGSPSLLEESPGGKILATAGNSEQSAGTHRSQNESNSHRNSNDPSGVEVDHSAAIPDVTPVSRSSGLNMRNAQTSSSNFRTKDVELSGSKDINVISRPSTSHGINQNNTQSTISRGMMLLENRDWDEPEDELTNDDLLDSVEKIERQEISDSLRPFNTEGEENANDFKTEIGSLRRSYGGGELAENPVPSTSTGLLGNRRNNELRDTTFTDVETLVFSDLEVHNSRTGETKPLKRNYTLSKYEDVQVKESCQKFSSKSQLRYLLTQNNIQKPR